MHLVGSSVLSRWKPWLHPHSSTYTVTRLMFLTHTHIRYRQDSSWKRNRLCSISRPKLSSWIITDAQAMLPFVLSKRHSTSQDRHARCQWLFVGVPNSIILIAMMANSFPPRFIHSLYTVILVIFCRSKKAVLCQSAASSVTSRSPPFAHSASSSPTQPATCTLSSSV